MRFGVIQFPDSDCGQSLIDALAVIQVEAVNIWHEESAIKNVDAILVSGGIQWLEYIKNKRETSAIIEALIEYAYCGGYVIGTGEGFRLLTHIKLLQGSFETNKSGRYFCKNIFIRVDNSDSALTTLVDKNSALKLPLATSNGRYIASENDLMMMRQKKQIIFRYCDEKARISEKVNYTGSVDNIAAISNEKANVFGISPRIELALDEKLGNSDGRYIFESLIAWIK